MEKSYVAVDLGASSGRVILGSLQNETFVLEEIRRIPNGMTRVNGHLVWNYLAIFDEIKAGLKTLATRSTHPISMSVDTWGVDFVLLDENDNVIGQTVGYRDERTEGMEELTNAIVTYEQLYKRTGTLRASYNTIYQLMAIKEQHPEEMARAHTLLMVPDYFHFLLTGKKTCEYSEATTSGLMNPVTKDWDRELIDKLGLPQRIFLTPTPSGTDIGTLRPELVDEIGFDLMVTASACHDTQSAIAALPAEGEDNLYISSGTWSLMGVERPKPDCSERSARHNFTNEGGFGGCICYHRNIMGLWMIQQLRHEYEDRYSFAELCEMAEENKAFPSRVEAGDESFLSPASMKEAVQEYCRASGQPVPETPGELAMVIYASLADCYQHTAERLDIMTGHTYEDIYIVGGGSQADFLNRLTAKACKKRVHAGPAEATAIGNILIQMISHGEVSSLEEGRKLVKKSFEVKVYE